MKFLKRNGNGGGDAPVAPLFNPYLNARKVWNSQIDRAFSDKHVCQLMMVAALFIAAAAVVGMAYIASLPRFIPYIVQVDKLGETVAVGPAQIAAPADTRIIRASLAAFIANLRLVTPDQELEKKSLLAVYGMIQKNDPACAKVNELINGAADASTLTQATKEVLGGGSDSSPFERAKKVTVYADVSTVLPLTVRSWEVDWTETVRDRTDGSLIGKPTLMRAMIDIYVNPPKATATQSELQRNPLGIFVRDYNMGARS